MDEKTTWTTLVGGREVQIPATIDGVRQALAADPARLAEFEAEIGRTPAARLAQTLAMWALPVEAWAEIDAQMDRLAAGDFSGCTPMEDLPGYEPAGEDAA
ncbi:hypothetical protein [Streptomyces clavuligerus]|uniref:Uncharacterized protein n=1 Tax=Streptomyces clavuligerus TaxID=1901 RepID=Q6TMU0_STRCL|nr:hypothetical protein [Streptomyces clavuligerus]AAQ93533.1 hypothetical protein pSCL2.4.H9.2 [Streptomyces clavuligerus]AXU16830.1 hypothetical protein D1794_29120 [Streptomyces clavuligerus]EDY48758.1 conserved hypothetical protein [Streptomyces clavuligerus]MBY6300965.1 hypothetical protein [Streptomyces clavuligerus]QPJ97024.1 hypothetical protein GE265_28335 [Streptomyces clavuligerus]